MTLAAAVDWRRSVAGTLVFTNGVFDLLHPGHLVVIESARALGDALVVAVNSDASVRMLGKGDDRPIIPEQDRAAVVAALGAVDAVILFEDPTPLAVIEALAPDIIVKGGDYREEDVVGAEVTKANGGRVVIVPTLQGRSTTGIVERLRESS